MTGAETYTRSLAQIVVWRPKFHLNQTEQSLYIAETAIGNEDPEGIKILAACKIDLHLSHFAI